MTKLRSKNTNKCLVQLSFLVIFKFILIQTSRILIQCYSLKAKFLLLNRYYLTVKKIKLHLKRH